MASTAKTPDEYAAEIPADRAPLFNKLRETILENLPDGFEETISYGMIGYVVPKTIFPAGYHCDPKLPLTLMSVASQKNFIALYHMGMYADPKLFDWFVAEFPKHSKSKPDMGKSCIRFKKMNDIPFALIGELASKTTVQDWINRYETLLKK